MVSFFFNGLSWVQTTVLDKLHDLTLSGTLTTGNISFSGTFSTDSITQANGGSQVELFANTTTSTIYFGGGNSSNPQHTTGPIIIGSDSTATGGINIGTGTDLSDPLTNTINIGSATYGTIIKGTLTSDTNVYYTSNTTTSNTIEYLQGGISVINIQDAGNFAFGSLRLNKIVNVWAFSNQAQTITLPPAPIIGQMMFIRCGKQGGSISLIATAGTAPILFPSNLTTLSGSGKISITLPLVGASQWAYTSTNRWVQIDTSLAPLADTDAGTTALAIGPNVVNGNIVIGAALGQGDVSIGTAQTSGGTVTIGSGSTLTSFGGDVSLASNKTIFTSSAQQMRMGYANTLATAPTLGSSLGPFFKSFGPASFTGTTYLILYEGANGLFTATGLDGCGGLLTITVKNTNIKFASYIFNMCKRDGVFCYDSLAPISTSSGGWNTAPSTSRVGNTNNITVTLSNTADWTGATISWWFMGSS
jgi:hypothetical protein